ncbi:tetratricopeptide repeat protein [Shewanella sp. Isolate11]|uniref:tetratricopeptide repeat protein n=1 Tax=Shewanella sp. Isolate11 TaxID=2908530 RepID=UPI001EFE1573|nr:tetratricopeptide repeat protein [Shewanella sp. Isolate11]MCG9695587.1 sel1 repeat family protein [Shewanella sp. Isolate11]
MTRMILALTLLSITSFSYASSLPECDTSECKEYFKAYKILTKRGHSDAMATLGELYYAGYGTEKDPEQALKWFRRAAKFGNTTAQYKAGVMYLQDTDEQDIDKGITLLKRSTKVDFSPSAFVLGKVYLSNDLGKQDLAEADHWLAKAYELDNKQAQYFSKKLKSSPQGETLALPALYALIDADKSVPSGSPAPVGEMETITVTAPDYNRYFNDEIARLNNSRPDTETGTGSNIAGRTCAEMWGCSSEADSLRIRDVMLSDWGLETLSFRIDER